jgi:hypothetical protein
MMEDNQGVIAIASNPVAHAKKHTDNKYHWVHEVFKMELLTLAADQLTI